MITSCGKLNKALKTIIVFDRGDYDGKCSAVIAQSKIPKATMFPWSFGTEIDWDLIEAHDQVIILDCNFFEDEHPDGVNAQVWLANNKDLIYIDHHHSEQLSILHNVAGSMNGIWCDNNESSSCEMAWEYFYRGQPMPRAVYLLGAYDRWAHDEDRDIIPFQYGMREDEYHISHRAWDLLMFGTDGSERSELARILKTGKIIHKYVISDNKFKASGAFDVELDGHRFLALNTSPTNSITLDSKDDGTYAGIIIVQWRKSRWNVTLYSSKGETPDLGNIARNHGGGGREGAAGFKCQELPFQLT